MDNSYEYFICFRGDNDLGGAIAGNVYNTINGIYKKKCYFSSAPNIVRCENYREKEEEALANAKCIIYILTKTFFSRVNDEEDEVRYELITSFNNPNIKKYVVAHSNFNWNEVDKDLLSSLIGKENFDYFKHIDYIKYTGQRDYIDVVEKLLVEALGLDTITLDLVRNIDTRLMKHLKNQLEDRRKYSGSYNLGKITNKLFPSIGNINRTLVDDSLDEIKTVSLFSLLLENKKNDYLMIGDGGIGKTVLMLETCNMLLEHNVPTVYIPLHEIQNDTIENLIFNNDELLGQTFFNAPYCVLLMDGFNEVADSMKSSVLKEIEKLAKRDGVQVVMTSRFNPRQYDMTFVGFEVLKLEPLSFEQISDYISSCNIEVPNDQALLEILSYPLMLTLYTNAVGYKETHGMHEALIWKDNPSSDGHIIWNFLQTQLQKSVFEMSKQKELLNYIFALEYILPSIGFYMLENEKFDISKIDLINVIKSSLTTYQNKWNNNEDERISEVSFYFDVDPLNYDGPSILKILTKELNLLNKSINKNYTFFHQNFRDCLAAIHLINVSHDQEIPLDWSSWIEVNVIKLISELMSEEEYNTLLDKVRGKEFNNDNLIVSNLIDIYHLWHGNDFSEFNFRGLDLSNISLREYNFKEACFDECKISPITFLQRGHTDTILDIISTPNTDQFISASVDGSIMIWNSLTASFKGVLTGHEGAVTSLRLIEEDKLLSAAIDGTVRMWNLKNSSGNIIYKHDKSILQMDASENNVFIKDDNSLYIFDYKFKLINKFENITYFRYEKKSKKLFMVNNYKNVILLNDSFKEDSNYAFDMKITALLYYYSKNFLFIGFDNGKLYYLNLESQNLHEIGKHDKIINRIIPINEKYIASGSEDKKIIIWDFANCKPYSEINAHHKGIIALEYIKRKNLIVSGSIDNSIKVWNASDGTLLKTIEGYTNWINGLAKAKDAPIIASASGDKSLRIWNYDTYSWVHTYKDHKDWAYSCDLSRNGEICISASCDGTVIVRNLNTHEVIMSETLHTGDIKTVDITSDGKIAASCGSDGYLYVYDVLNNRIISEFNFGAKIYRIILKEDGKKILVGCVDSCLHLFDIENNRIIWTNEAIFEGGIRGLDVTSDYSKVICGGDVKIVKEFNVEDGSLNKVFDFNIHTRAINYNEDESLISAGDLYGQIEVVNIDNEIIFSKNVIKVKLELLNLLVMM